MNEPEQNPTITVSSAAVLRIFQAQHGIATRKQLLDAGVHRSAIGRAVRLKQLIRVYPGVYRFAATPESEEQRLMAACLAVSNAVVSHRAAAWLHGFAGFAKATKPEVATTTRGRARGVTVHRVSDLEGPEITRVRGIPVTREGRTLLDLGSVCAAPVVAKALDEALRRKLVAHSTLVRLLAAVGGKGRRGSATIRRLLRERGPEDARAASELETRFLRLVRRAKLPRPRQNCDLRDENGDFIARPDFHYRDARIAIFLDGRAYHSDHATFEKDRSQANSLTAAGWMVLRYTWRHVEQDGPTIARALGAALVARSTLTGV